MSIFAVTFRVHLDTKDRYDRCYNALVPAIRAQTTTKHWDEPTSFVLIESTKTPGQIADAIVQATPAFDKANDLLVVINLASTKGSAIRGKVRDLDYNFLILRR